MNQQEIDACVAAILSYAPQTSHAVAVEAARRALLQRDRPQPQPPTWNGLEDGLPPVGLEVEVLWSSITKVYVTGKILAHDGDRAVFRFTTGERKGEYQADKPHSWHGADLPNFRPIRTAEQLAAEERERVTDEMVRRFALHNVDAPWKGLFLQMYDSGVLKVEQP